MARGKRIPDEIRAKIIAALLEGQGVTDVADKYEIPHQTISSIKDAIGDQFGVDRPKKRDLSEMIYEYLEEGFKTATAELQAVRESSYLAKQDIASIATHFGVLSDKLFRILSAIDPAEGE